MFVIIGFGGMALSLLLMALSTSIGEYLFANLLFGLLTTAAAPVGTVLILESFDKSEWPNGWATSAGWGAWVGFWVSSWELYGSSSS
jgi:MFS family permease